MIVDHRTYAIKPGKLNEFVKLYEKEMLPLQLKYLGRIRALPCQGAAASG